MLYMEVPGTVTYTLQAFVVGVGGGMAALSLVERCEPRVRIIGFQP